MNEDSLLMYRFEGSLDQFAEIQHDIWSHWMDYMFKCGVTLPDGTWVMPEAMVGRWRRQLATAYKHLSESEKESDRQVVLDFFFPNKVSLD